MLTIRDDRQLRSLTGVSQEVLEKLEPVFSAVYKQQQDRRYEVGRMKGQRERKAGAGRKSKLETMYDKLCFVLYYLKTYPTFDALAETFNLSRSNAHKQVHSLMPLLSESLAYLGYLPERECEDVIAFHSMCEGVESLLIDVTERECQRPKDDALQKEHYSGKKGYHTLKHTIMSSPDKVILLVGKSFAGRNHDYAMLKAEFEPSHP